MQRRGTARRTPLKRQRVDIGASADGAASTADVPIAMNADLLEQKMRTQLSSTFSTGAPFAHALIRPFLGDAALRAVRADLEKIGAKEKETDLFRFFQTGDLAGALLASENDKVKAPTPAAKKSAKRRRGQGIAVSAAAKAPSLTALAKVFASDDFRELMSEVTQCGELAPNRVDLSAQIYSRRSHLLCHDDVIGTRKVSFIYYLTDPTEDWQSKEGGALELYPAEPGAAVGTPSTTPAKEVLPLADGLLLFVVEPGVSFHSVREVRGARARVSIQGWLHAPSLEQTAAFGNRGHATLQQLLNSHSSPSAGLSADGDQQANVVFQSTIAKPADAGNAEHAEEFTDEVLSPADAEYLSKYIRKEYLDPKCLTAINERFAETSYAVLTDFLRSDLAESLTQRLATADTFDGFSAGAEEPAVPVYDVGEKGGWQMVGPPHLRRYLRFNGAQDVATTASSQRPTPSSSSEAQPECSQQRLGASLHEVASGLFSSPAFRRWLKHCTSLEPRNAGRVEVRRFRPGLDYVVAARAETAVEAAELDATIAVVAHDKASAELWEGEDVGGFESYVAADEDVETAKAQETYRGTDLDGPLVNLPAASNALCLVMRDAQTLRFVKYLSRDAPSSRADIAASYKVDAPPDTSDEEVETAGAGGAK